jgi:hypothetical protein
MMKRRKSILITIGTLLFAGFAFAVTACDSVEQEANAAVLENEDLIALSADLSESVPLSEQAKQDLNSVLAQHQQRVMEPGFLWYVAAGLQKTLGEEQKERMINLLDRIERERFRRFRRDGIENGLRRRFDFGPLGPVARDLSEEQREQLAEIRENYREQIKEVLEGVKNGEVEREDAENRLAEIREAMRVAIDGVLTEEQKAERDEMLEERKERREEHRQAQREAMIDALDLTPEQVEALDALREDQLETLVDWRGGFWDNDFERGAFMSDRLGIHEEMEEALADILTEAQLETVKIHRVLVQRNMRNRQDGRRSLGRGDRGPDSMWRGRGRRR